VVLTGETNSVPLTLVAGVDVAGMQFSLAIDTLRLTNVALTNLGPTVSSATLVPGASNRVDLLFSASSGQTFPAGGALAQLQFQALAGAMSGFVWLKPSSVTGTRSGGGTLTNGIGGAGRVVVVGNLPVLEVVRGANPSVMQYAWPGFLYQLESSTNLLNGWNTAVTIDQSNRAVNVGLSNLPPAQFFRSYR
jgi:hypothetical protein